MARGDMLKFEVGNMFLDDDEHRYFELKVGDMFERKAKPRMVSTVLSCDAKNLRRALMALDNYGGELILDKIAYEYSSEYWTKILL